MGAGASAQKGKGRSIATSPAGGNHGKASKQPSDLSVFAHRSWVMISHAEDVVSVVRCLPPMLCPLHKHLPTRLSAARATCHCILIHIYRCAVA